MQMPEKYQNKYTIPSARLQNWNYGNEGAYFITICTLNARKMHADFAWQTRFHDHIIRNDAEYERIKNYIVNNPIQWKETKFYE